MIAYKGIEELQQIGNIRQKKEKNKRRQNLV